MYYHAPIFDRLQDCWNPISEDQLGQLEDALKADFPDDYRHFLLHFDAGEWSHAIKARVLEPNQFLDDVAITSTYGIISDDRFTGDDIQNTVGAYSDDIPDTFVPIMDAMGAPVCMDLGEENYGKVYYWGPLA